MGHSWVLPAEKKGITDPIHILSGVHKSLDLGGGNLIENLWWKNIPPYGVLWALTCEPVLKRRSVVEAYLTIVRHSEPALNMNFVKVVKNEGLKC